MAKTPVSKHTFTIMGNPIPLARARINPKSFFNNTARKMFDPQKELKLITAITLRNQFENLTPLTGPLHLDVIFYMSIPKSSPKIKKELTAGNIYHIARPDLDNLVKWICDVSANILYGDDSVIASTTAKKVYDKNPRTVFTLKEIK